MPTDTPDPTDDTEAYSEIAAILGRGGPRWIPADEANAEMERVVTEAEDARAFQAWDALKASGNAVAIPHDEARRRLGLRPRGTAPELADHHE
ncbi:hypothetical protein [Kribbella catacumbae]|uniref:hypothetical protein n=1 Tax=Kribbella catacumbae TaxID=460086 RepID=UPI0012F83B2B|nr:hypothetical protein [Kribbella catacumbae]